MQPSGLQCRNQRANVASQKLHENDTDDRDRHGYGADDFHAVAFFRDEGEGGERPNEAQQHFIEAGKWRVAGLVPAVRHRSGISDEAGPRGHRRELDIGLRSSNAEAEIERAGTGVENQRRIQQIGFAQNVSALHHIEKRNKQQKGDAEADHDDQSHSGRGMLFYFCPCHVLLILSAAGLTVRRSLCVTLQRAVLSAFWNAGFSSFRTWSTNLWNVTSKASRLRLAEPPIQSIVRPSSSVTGTTQKRL